MKPIKTTSCGTATIRVTEEGHEVLLVQPRAHQDRWAFPKGHTDQDEVEEDAAVRETWEETGVAVLLMPELLGTFDVKLKHEHKTVFIYMAYPEFPESCEPSPRDDENHDVRWWPLHSLPEPIPSQAFLFERLPDVVRRVWSDE